MKQEKIIEAYRVLKNMAGESYPLPVAYSLYNLRKSMEPQADFQLEQEKKLIEEFNGKPGDNGLINFGDQENAQKFLEKLKELGDLEVDFIFTPIDIPISGDIKITPNDIEKLDGFVNFV